MGRRSTDDESPNLLPVYDVRDAHPGPDDPPDALSDPGRAVSRRAMTVLIAVAVLVVSGLVAVRLLGDDHASERRADRTGRTSPVEQASPVTGSHPVRVGPGSVADLTIGRAGVFLLQHGPDRISHLPLGAALPDDAVFAPTGTLRLSLEPDGKRLWALAPTNQNTTAVRAYDLNGGADLSGADYQDWGLPGTAETMAAIDGTGWVVSDAGLIAVTATRLHTFDVGTVEAIAADPTRHRIVLTAESRGTTTLWAATNRSGQGPAVQRLATLVTGATSLAVTAFQIWITGPGSTALTGYEPGGAANVVLMSSVSAGGRVLSVGEQVVWLSGPSDLECLNQSASMVVHRWPGLTGPVVSIAGFIYVVVDGGLMQLDPVGSCGG